MSGPSLHDGVYLICDGCHVEYLHHRERATLDALKAAVDRKATKAGWKLRAGKALCPACKPRSVN